MVGGLTLLASLALDAWLTPAMSGAGLGTDVSRLLKGLVLGSLAGVSYFFALRGLCRVADRLEARATGNERRFRAVFDQSLDAALELDTEMGIVAANRAAEEGFGMTRKELCRLSFPTPTEPGAPGVRRTLTRPGGLRPGPSVVTLRRWDGSTFNARVACAPCRNGPDVPHAAILVRPVEIG